MMSASDVSDAIGSEQLMARINLIRKNPHGSNEQLSSNLELRGPRSQGSAAIKLINNQRVPPSDHLVERG